MRAIAFAVVLAIWVSGCGRSAEEQQLLDMRDSVFEAAGVTLPQDLNYGFRHNVSFGRCGDIWSLSHVYRPANHAGYDPATEPVPIEVAAAVAARFEPGAIAIQRYEELSFDDDASVVSRAVDWTTGSTAGVVHFTWNIGYTVRVTMVESCPEPISLPLGQLSLRLKPVDQFGIGDALGCGGDWEPCADD